MPRTAPIILAIETSCDDTAAAIICNGKIKSNLVAAQSVHASYGGTVPELASRAHQQCIIPVVRQAVQEAHIELVDLDAVAFTQGPGLLGALLLGTSFAKSVAFALGISLIAVNHMKAHALANFIDEPYPNFPLICLTVSGGHTQLVLAKDHLDMEVIGTTHDDAVGEAFDKLGKLLGFPYPGGPLIDQHAKRGNAQRFSFPSTTMPQLDFSFSGIKTAVFYFIRENQKKDAQFVVKHREDLCASIQATLVDMLLSKLKKAVVQTGIKNIALAGGVAANSGLRGALEDLAKQENWKLSIPRMAYCTDNAAMVAMAAHYQYLTGDFCNLKVTAKPRLPF